MSIETEIKQKFVKPKLSTAIVKLYKLEKRLLLQKFQYIIYFQKLIWGLILLFILLSNKYAISQDMIIYDETKKSEIVFKYSPYERDASLPNYFISSMAHSQNRMRSYYSYKISAYIHSIITKKNLNNYLVLIEIDSLRKIGNFDYKGFNFSKIIIPKEILFSYSLIEINNNIDIVYNVPLTYPELKKHYTIKKNYFDSTKIGTFKLANEKFIYQFEKQQKQDFDSAILLIDNYYSDGKKLLNIEEDLSKLKPNNIDNIKLQNIDLKYINKRFQKISLPSYSSKLSLNIKDPAGYYSLYNKVDSQINNLQNQFSINIANLDSLFYVKAMKFMADSNVNKAIIYFNNSIEINKSFSPGLYQLALIDYKNKKLISAEQKLNTILEKTTNNQHYNKLANKVYKEMIDKSIALNSQENYIDGLETLQEAKQFCNRNSNIIVCNKKQEQLIDKARYGIYNSYLSIAEAAMQRGRLDMTEDYLNIANKYKNDNLNSIKDTSNLNALYTLLVTNYLSQSIELKNNYEFQKSKRKWMYADSLCRTHKLEDANTFVSEVEKQLGDYKYNQAIITSKNNVPKYEINVLKNKTVTKDPYSKAVYNYKEHYEKAGIYFNYRRYSQAYNELKLANEIKQKFNISTNDSLDSYLRQSSKAMILKNLKKINLYIWGKKFRSAEMMLSKAEQQIIANDLDEDKELTETINGVKAELKKQQESKISKLFENKMLKARQSANLKDFISLENYCNEAITLSENNKEIPLDINYPHNLKRKYSSIIAYQKVKKNAYKFRDLDNYNKAIKAFNNANQLFVKDSLQRFSILKQSLYSFINENPSKGLIEAGITYSLTEKDVFLALDLWKEAIGYKWVINRELAANIMTGIGEIDKQNNPNINKKELYYQRFGKNPNFSKYKKYYLKAF